MDSTFFSYNLDKPPFVESWGQGLVVLHNPNARHPLPRDFFFDASQVYIEAGVVRSDPSAWHPLSSKTLIYPLGEDVKQKLRVLMPTQFAVPAITKAQFHAICEFAAESNPVIEEHGWFMDETEAFLGVVLWHKSLDHWGYVVFGLDPRFCFREIESQLSILTRYHAVAELQHRISQILSYPQRIFPPSSP
jgi:hypothetical protein